MFTAYDFVRWENTITANTAEPIMSIFSCAIRWMLDDFATGTTFRVFRAAWEVRDASSRPSAPATHLDRYILGSGNARLVYRATQKRMCPTSIGIGTSVGAFFAIFMNFAPPRELVVCDLSGSTITGRIFGNLVALGNLLRPADRGRRRCTSQGIGECQRCGRNRRRWA